MEPKFNRGQRVLIRSVKNQHYQLKYPEIEQYVGESGSIAESYWIGASEPSNVGVKVPNLSENYFYRVRLDLQNKLVTIPEEALEPLYSDDWD